MTDPGPTRRAPASGTVEAGRRIRLARIAAGLTQSQLARLCRVSRQAVAGAEAGSWSPSLGVALQLARSLGTTVDQLFATEQQARAVVATALDDRSLPARARLALVWDRWVALPLTGDRGMLAGFKVASGRKLTGAAARSWGTGRSLVVAGCDPALPLLSEPIAAAGEGWALEWWACSSREALRLLDQGLVHAAAVHNPVGGNGSADESVRRMRIGFAGWREGILLGPSQAPGAATGLEELLERGVRWVNREPGAEARALLDRELEHLGRSGAQLNGYESHAAGHLQVASALASGSAEAGIATEPAALLYDLPFLPLVEEECALQVDRDRLDTPELRLLLAALSGPTLARELRELPGYRTEILGQEG
ncbi:MAG TPA: substrate-binding domain-containing protein [Candidatus Dormibacteraeota bacterium]|nr:substrate-binding domain-containing protein [Candidatus Dormibacteraeota bacterium]